MLICTNRPVIGEEYWVTDRELVRGDIITLGGGIKARVTSVRPPGETKFFCVELPESRSPGKVRKVRKNRSDITIIKEIK